MFINLRGYQFAYDDRGQGTIILFIHGYPLSRKLWLPQIEFLSRYFRTITLDLRGHGDTQEIPGSYSMEMLAEDCNKLLDSLGVDIPIILCGLSMGGYISMAFYRQFSARVSGLIWAATRANADTQETRKNRDKAIAMANQEGSRAIAESMLPQMFAPATYESHPSLVSNIRDMMEKTSVAGITGALNGIKNRLDSTPMLPFIKVPTLIIHGAEDQLIPVTVAQEMANSILGAQLSIIPGAGHLLNQEQPTLFNQAVYDFVLSLS